MVAGYQWDFLKSEIKLASDFIQNILLPLSCRARKVISVSRGGRSECSGAPLSASRGESGQHCSPP